MAHSCGNTGYTGSESPPVGGHAQERQIGRDGQLLIRLLRGGGGVLVDVVQGEK